MKYAYYHLLLCTIVMSNLSAMEKSPFEIPEVVQNIGTKLPIRDIITLQGTCKQLNQELSFNNNQFLTVLAANPVDYTDSQLITAIFNKKNAIVKVILSRTREVDKNVFNCCNKHNVTPLMFVCTDSQSTEMLDLLLRHGADIRYTVESRNIFHYIFLQSTLTRMLESTLNRIVENQNREVITKLINQQDTYGYTPLHWLLFRFNQKKHPMKDYIIDLDSVLAIIKILKNYNVDSSIQNSYHQTPIEILGYCVLGSPNGDRKAIENALSN